MTFLLGMLLSFVPKRLRFRFKLSEAEITRGAFWSGLAEAVICLGAWCGRFLWFVQYRTGTLAQGLINKGQPEAMGSEQVAFGAGLVTWIEYVLQPVSLLLVFFIVEGMVRYVNAYLNDEAVPTLPLQLISSADLWIERRRHQAWLGEKVPDEVLVGSGQDFALRVASCRPKQWNHLTTISYQDQLFEMFKEEVAEPPRRFIYLLRKAPAHKVVRGLHHYDPEEVVNESKLEV